MKNMKFSLAASVLILSLLSPLNVAFAGLNIVHTFSNGDTKLMLATYTTDTDVVSLLGIAHQEHKVSYGFRGTDWEQMRSLVQKAATVQTKKWLEEGSMAETDTTSPSHLLIYVNDTTIQFVISDPTTGTNNFMLPRSDVDDFLRQSAEVAKALAHPKTPQ